MTSNINPNNINGNYPVAGQDNDSQGFRDNFTNIKTNFGLAKNEIDDLQSKVLLKSALGPAGGAPANDLNYALLYRAKLKAESHSFKDHGTMNGNQEINFLDGSLQKVTTGGPLNITFSNFPATGTAGSLKLWISVIFAELQTSADVSVPASVTLGTSSIANLEDNMITFNAAGDYLFEFITVDGGNNFWILKLT